MEHSRTLFRGLVDNGLIKEPPESLLQAALDWAVSQI
jgi:hypothetical protein